MPSLQPLEPEPNRAMSSAGAHMRRAGLLVSERRLEEAEVEIARALTEAPDDLRANKLLALVRFRLGRLVDAREAYRRVIAVAPADAAARLNLGLIALKLERFDEAADELSAAVGLRPDDRRALGYLGHAYARLGRTAEAVRVFYQAGQPGIAAELESRAAVTSHPAVLDRDGLASPFDAREQRDQPAPEAGQPLTGFLHGRLVDSGTKTSVSGEGVYRLVLGDERETSPNVPGDAQVYVQAGAFLAAVGTVAVEPALRRQRGQETAAPLASEGAVFLACRGRGELWLTPVSPILRLDALTLEEDALFVRESSVLAFSGDLVWESGAIPRSGVRMLHLHGSGAVVVDWLGRDVVAMRLAEGQPLTVPLHRLCGWLGQLVLRLQPAARPAGPTLIACEGEGVLLVARNGHAPGP